MCNKKFFTMKKNKVSKQTLLGLLRIQQLEIEIIKALDILNGAMPEERYMSANILPEQPVPFRKPPMIPYKTLKRNAMKFNGKLMRDV